MKPMHVALVMGCVLVQAGCSRAPDTPHLRPAPRTHAPPRPVARTMTENEALELLVTRLKANKVPDLQCLTFSSQEEMPAGSRAARWEFDVHEIHNDACGGDPLVWHLRASYRVNAAGTVWVYDVGNDEYKRF